MSPRTGRPTNNPKPQQLTVRLDSEAADILDRYAKKYRITRTEAARKGIKKLKDDLKENDND